MENSASGSPKWTPEQLKKVREETSTILSNLDQDITDSEPSKMHDSWLRGKVHMTPTERCAYFDRYGFINLSKFTEQCEIDCLKQQMKELASTWDPATKTIAFRTDEKSNEAQGSDDYFLESASRVHYFAEADALNEDGSLKSTYTNNKLAALNKAGHGMHMIPGAFREYSISDKIKSLVTELGWQDPVVPQSMYIFKQAEIGGAVNSHQDSTFLYTEPKQSCLGLWLALDDATLENGCLWLRPKSHNETVRRQFKRNDEYFGPEAIDNHANVGKGNLAEPKMVMERLVTEELYSKASWEGNLPEGSEHPCKGLFDAGFIPIEVKAGDLLAFPGTLDHLSLPNTSSRQRHTFQLHLVEGPNAGVTWSQHNWLQYPKGTPFLSVKGK